jgi:alpha-galactosidase/6-phospho-beta-glucosidase family protein
MPEEIEVPTEHLHETLQEAAEGHGGHGGGGEGPNWISQVALSAAVLAVAAAVAALLAGHHANEAMLEQMQATDAWSYYQAKGIKANLVESNMETLLALGKEPKEDEKKKFERYKEEQKGIEEKAKEKEHSSAQHMERHVIFARAVTAFQVGIALAAISVLSRRKLVWFCSLALGAIGSVFLVQALL